jgi:ankyrin repeat protein
MELLKDGDDLQAPGNNLIRVLLNLSQQVKFDTEAIRKLASSKAPEAFGQSEKAAATRLDIFMKGLVNRANVNLQGKYGRTALHCAAETENGREIIQLLVQNKANLNVQDEYGRTALHQAAEKKNNEVIRLLVDKSADVNLQDNDGQTALELTVKNRDKIGIQLLLSNGVDVTGKAGQVALEVAVEKRWQEILELLVNKGVDIKTENGQRALRLAVDASEERWEQTLQLLIDKGVDLNTEDAQGTLTTACHRGKKVMELLVKNGVDVKTFKGEVALWEASKHGYKAKVELLVEAGANVNAEYAGRRVLYIAADNKRWEIVGLLVKAKADITKPDSEEYTVLELARDAGAEARNIVEVLEKTESSK